MNIYTCNDDYGIWPAGAASIVIAKNKKIAKTLLDVALTNRSIAINDYTLTKVDIAKQQAIILCDGDY